jgi:hypothetical protein
MTLLGLVGAVHPIAVKLPRSDFRKEYLPYLIGPLLYSDVMSFFFLIRAVKQTELYSRGVLREQGEVDTFTVPCRPQWIGMTGTSSDTRHSDSSLTG